MVYYTQEVGQGFSTVSHYESGVFTSAKGMNTMEHEHRERVETQKHNQKNLLETTHKSAFLVRFEDAADASKVMML